MVICVDFGSTFTKSALIDLADGAILAAADHRTTIDTDVLDGFDACLARLVEGDPRAADAPVLACSSAGGGLRIAVVGNEELVTAEAGRRVALSSGGKVVAVVAAADGHDFDAELITAEPDVVLLTGGTDGGNDEVLLDCARQLASGTWQGPVVVAGNVDARAEVAAILAGHPHVLADNVVPRIGVLTPDSARSAIREMFLAHVIGGKHLSARTDFAAMVRGATPDVVLTGVELLARGLDDHPGAGDVVVVDVGGATTDVHSVIEVDPEDALTEDGLAREVVATTPVTRTVEGDLGMRWSAVSTVSEAVASGLVEDDDGLRAAAEARAADPAYLPDSPGQAAYDEAIAAAAVGVALRRHAGRSRVVLSPEGRVVERTGKDLREVDLLVGSGGVLRNGADGVAERVLGAVVGEVEGGWQLPRRPVTVVDVDYVLAAAGLLVEDHPEAASRLVHGLHPGVA
ncbi:glutamate mutase [Nocardioides sp. Soil797]|nr:glutamate mutase [Nocardioides sp. Soil797]